MLGVSAGIGLVVALGGFAAWVRLLPWMFAADVPWRVLLPFARLLSASVLEVGLIVGGPIGLVSYWQARADAGELTALLALGCRPGRIAWGQLLPLAACVVPGLLLAAWVSGPTQAAPSRVLGQLVTASDRACASQVEPLARIPVGGLVQDCASGWLVGALPGGGWIATQRAGAPQLTDSAERLDLGSTELFFRAPMGASPSVAGFSARVGQASFVGIPRPPPGRRGLWRGLNLAVALCLQVLWVAALARAGRRLRRATFGAFTSCIVLLALLTQLDRMAVSQLGYFALPLAALVLWVGYWLTQLPRLNYSRPAA